jgi:hypothetical protein
MNINVSMSVLPPESGDLVPAWVMAAFRSARFGETVGDCIQPFGQRPALVFAAKLALQRCNHRLGHRLAARYTQSPGERRRPGVSDMEGQGQGPRFVLTK